MTRFLRLLLVTLLALAVGAWVGYRAYASFDTSDHRRYLPPVPANLAYEPPTTSGPDERLPVSVGTPDRPAAGQALRGFATWYATGPDCLCAAAGPALRHGHWRGSTVTVMANGRLIHVKLVDACACGPRDGLPTLLDLSDEAFRRLAPLSWGIIAIVVRP